MGRATSGVIGMRFSDGDQLLGMHVVREGADVLVATDGGYAKRTPVDQYPVQGRGGRGVLTARIVESRGELVGRADGAARGRGVRDHLRRRGDPDVGGRGQAVRPADMGVRLVNLASGQSLVAIARNAESTGRGRGRGWHGPRPGPEGRGRAGQSG